MSLIGNFSEKDFLLKELLDLNRGGEKNDEQVLRKENGVKDGGAQTIGRSMKVRLSENSRRRNGGFDREEQVE